jgi:hypothetical protein
MAKSKDDMSFTVRVLDETRKGFGSVMKGAAWFTKSMTSALTAPFRAVTSLNMMAGLYNVKAITDGFKAVYDGIDRIATESAKMKVVDASFESMTGRAGKYADSLAKDLKDAALGMITLTRAKEVANRALASGMNVDQLRTAMEFISKKAVTTGIDAGQALQTVITGLSRGSTLFLDDFGVLVDGTDQVKRDYDAIAGSGAFDKLGPAAQKAEIVRAAIADMQRQMGMIGVKGDELAFKLGRIKTQFSEIALKAGKAILPLADALSDSLESFGGKVDGVVSSFVEAVTVNYDRIKGMFAASFKGVGTMLGSTLMNAWKAFAGGIGSGDIVKSLSTTFAKLPLYLGKGFLKMKDVFGTFIRNFLEGIGKFTMILGEGLGKAMSLFGWGGVKKGQEVADSFADAGAEIHAMGMKAQFAMRVTQKEVDAVEEGLKEVDRQAAQMKTTFGSTRVVEQIGDAFRTAYNSARNFFAGLNPKERFKELATAAGDAAKKSTEAVNKMWEAFQRAAGAVKEATDNLNAARGAKFGVKIQEWQEDMALALAKAGPNEWLQNKIKFDYARKALGMSRGFKNDPEIQKQYEDFALGLLDQMRTDPRNLFGQPAKDIAGLYGALRDQRRGRAEGDVAEAQKQAGWAKDEAEVLRGRFVAEQKAIVDAKNEERKASSEAARQLAHLGAIAKEVGGRLAMIAANPIGVAGGWAVDQLEIKLGR